MCVCVCEFTEVACTYESLGCGVRMMRKDIIKYQENDDIRHLHLLLKSYISLEEKYSALEEKHKELVTTHQEQRQTLSEGKALIYAHRVFWQERKNVITYILPVYTHPGSYAITIGVGANGVGTFGTHLVVFSEIRRGYYHHQLEWPFQGTFTCELLNQLADDGHYRKVEIFTSSDDI